MNELLKKKERIESRITKTQERVDAYENKKNEEEDKLLSIAGEDEAKLTQEIAFLEAEERWAKEKLTLAEAKIEFAQIERDIFKMNESTKLDDSSANMFKLEAGIAEVKVSHAEARVALAMIAEKLWKLRFKCALSEKECERCGKSLENASESYKNANKLLENAIENCKYENMKLRTAQCKEVEASTLDPKEAETLESCISGRLVYFIVVFR